ncbi:hypothetical protein DFH09DRAFT_1113518 [Mycena vulgaris]|nr:hypothetical protein DFH09DRAFT_1113518 [Mycena vulgaris]
MSRSSTLAPPPGSPAPFARELPPQPCSGAHRLTPFWDGLLVVIFGFGDRKDGGDTLNSALHYLRSSLHTLEELLLPAGIPALSHWTVAGKAGGPPALRLGHWIATALNIGPVERRWAVQSLSLEHILTTALPLYIFFPLPHPYLVLMFTITQCVLCAHPLSVGAFVYLGFVAAGEEIEQPFGHPMPRKDTLHQCVVVPVQTRHHGAGVLFVNFRAKSKPKWCHGDQHERKPKHRRDASLLSPESNVPYAHTGADSPQIAHAYGGNMYRAALASLSDTVSLEDVTEEDEER